MAGSAASIGSRFDLKATSPLSLSLTPDQTRKTMEMETVRSSSPAEWRYVAEGGANLVVAYTGSLQLLDNSVLRVRKRAVLQQQLANDEEDASVAFTDAVVLPLLGGSGTPVLQSVRVDRAWLEQLAAHVEPARPASRRAVDVIDTLRSHVVLTANLLPSQPGVLGVEIKPKWGFMPDRAQLSEASREIKSSHCRFCLHRLHRMHDHGDSHSQAGQYYCPLDLYSGSEERTQTAVLHLVQAWKQSGGKGNNLKLFAEGSMLKPDQLSDLDALRSEGSRAEESLVHCLSSFLAASPLVQKLKGLQAELDALDIEGLGRLLREREGVDILSLSSDDIDRLGGEVTLAEYEAFVARFTYSKMDLTTRDAVISHLLSASFKDCSMILQIRTRHGKAQVVDAQLVDCDLKSISRLQRYAKLDRELVETCRRHKEEGHALPVCRI